MGAHFVGGGRLPGALVLAMLAVLVYLASAVLARWRLSPPGVLVALSAGQVALHHALAATEAASACTVPGNAHVGHHGATPGALAMSCDAVAAHAEHGVSVAMFGAHVVATLLSAAVLLLGERALWALLERVFLLFAVPGRRPAQLPPRRRARAWRRVQVPRRLSAGIDVAPRRGPPRGAPAF
ncbi:hypothetical protein GB882_13050 [Georgenia ruanii]|uniref:Uncharacterized protein n=1 Tax=Georgenia ruanii TaxID=348442 RepID=A0A7J9UY92_9MICO|nr:hypothetical protein [Georgenia ruanii]